MRGRGGDSDCKAGVRDVEPVCGGLLLFDWKVVLFGTEVEEGFVVLFDL